MRPMSAADDWLMIGRAGDVPLLEGRSVEVDGRRIAVFRLPDGWAATDHACPHRAGPLSDGIVTESCIVICPLHSHRFSLITGERDDGTEGSVRTYRIRERDGRLELLRADLHEQLESAA